MRNAAKNTALKIYLSQVKHKNFQDFVEEIAAHGVHRRQTSEILSLLLLKAVANSSVPAPGNLPFKAKMPGGSMGAAGID